MKIPYTRKQCAAGGLSNEEEVGNCATALRNNRSTVYDGPQIRVVLVGHVDLFFHRGPGVRSIFESWNLATAPVCRCLPLAAGLAPWEFSAGLVKWCRGCTPPRHSEGRSPIPGARRPRQPDRAKL